jgi:hypothetical protein
MSSNPPIDPSEDTDSPREERTASPPLTASIRDWVEQVRSKLQSEIEPYRLRFPRATRFLFIALKGMIALILLWLLPQIVLGALRAVGIESTAITSGVLLGALTALLMHKPMRKAIAASALLIIMATACVYTVKEWDRISAGEVSLDESIFEIAQQVFGNPVASNLTAQYSEHLKGIAQFPQRLISSTNSRAGNKGHGEIASGDFFRYLGSFNARTYTDIRKLAIAEIEPCESLDRACEIFHMLSYVATEVKYVNDPDGLIGDDVQSPDTTLDLMAGDCEDQTILLMTMLESVGIQTMIIFTEGHAYPMACTLKELPVRSRYMARAPLVYEFPDLEASHCYPLEPTDADNPRIGYKYEYFDDFIYAVEPSTNKHFEFDPSGG